MQQYNVRWVAGQNPWALVDAEVLVQDRHDPLPDAATPQIEHVDTILKMPEARGGVDNALLKTEQWVL